MSKPKKRILQVIPNLKRGGAERLVLDICNGIIAHGGAEVKLVTFSPENRYPELSGAIDITVVPVKINLSVLRKDQLQVEGFMDIVHQFKPDVIHSHLYEAEIVSREITVPGTRYFSHFHDNMPVFSVPAWQELITRSGIARIYEKNRILKKYSACRNEFICISNDTLQYARKSLGDKFRYHLLPNAVDFDNFNLSPYREPKNIRVLQLLNIGSFVEKKNQVFLLSVMRILLDKGISAQLTLLGDGPDNEMIKAKVKELELDKNVLMPGEVQHVKEYLQSADIYVHSATYEPFGLVMLEAMATGLPVVALDGRGNRDIIHNGDNGFLVEKQDAGAFADCINKLISDGSLYESMSKKAVALARQYDIHKYVNKLLEIY